MNQTTPQSPPAGNKPTGYRKKPAWIYLISAVLIFSPLGNLLWSLASMKVPDWYKPSVWIYWSHYFTVPTWGLLGLLFVAGISLLFVRRWSWALSMGVIGLICIYDIFMIKHFMALGIGAVIAMISGTLSFGLILYFSEFRKPYLNPRLRWWETSPRYKVELPASISLFDKAGVIADISRSGMLIEWPNSVEIPELSGMCTVSLPTDLKIEGDIKRRTARGYGVKFENLSKEQKKALMVFLETLELDPTKAVR